MLSMFSMVMCYSICCPLIVFFGYINLCSRFFGEDEAYGTNRVKFSKENNRFIHLILFYICMISPIFVYWFIGNRTHNVSVFALCVALLTFVSLAFVMTGVLMCADLCVPFVKKVDFYTPFRRWIVSGISSCFKKLETFCCEIDHSTESNCVDPNNIVDVYPRGVKIERQ